MRNIDERMAEIARRSEKRIQKRKKQRKRLIAACIPIVLCVSLYIASMPQRINGMESNGINEGEEGTVAANTLVNVQVQKGDTPPFSLSDKEQVAKAYDEIDALFGKNTDEIVTPEGTGREVYAITFCYADGTQTVFTLDGTILCNETTEKRQQLTAQQLVGLKQMLGLPG